MNPWRHIAGFVGLLALFAAPRIAVAQPEWDGAAAGDLFGTALACGMIDKDKHADMVVGAPGADRGLLEDAGAVYVVSGQNGRRLYTKRGRDADDGFGLAVACGKVNGDRYTDFVVGAPFANPGGAWETGEVSLFSGKDGRRLIRLQGEADDDRFGWAIALGDVTGDDRDDLVVGAPHAGTPLESRRGSVYHFAGQTYAATRLDGETEDDYAGWSVACPDLNQDGHDDVIASAPSDEWLLGAGRVICYSGQSLIQLGSFTHGIDGERLGMGLAACDLDRDGAPEALIGAPYANPGGRVDAGLTLAVERSYFGF